MIAWTYSIKTKIFSKLGTGYCLKVAKINSQQEKPICSNLQTQQTVLETRKYIPGTQQTLFQTQQLTLFTKIQHNICKTQHIFPKAQNNICETQNKILRLRNAGLC